MSFLNKVKNNSLGIKTNPFTTERKAESTMTAQQFNDPFLAKPVIPTGNQFGTTTAAKPSFLGGTKPSIPNKPVGMPSAIKPNMPKPAAATPSPVPVSAPTPAQVPTKEEVKKDNVINQSAQEMINEMETIEMKEPIIEEKVAKQETFDTLAEEKKTETEEKKTKTKSKTSRKKSSTKTATKKTEVDEPINEELAETIETFFKMPKTTLNYAEAIKRVRGNFVDENWEAFRKSVIEESDAIVIESDMQEGAVKKTISKLSTLREKIWVQFMDTKTVLESLSNKDAEGLIERVKFVNLEGSNETARKKSGVIAVMNYKTDEGENINLYELYDETKDRFYFLKGIMDTIQYKTQVLITMSSALKLEKNHINNHQ